MTLDFLARTALCLMILGLAACGYATGPAGQLSPASRYNPVSGEVNSPGR